jgi:hypothetical protein
LFVIGFAKDTVGIGLERFADGILQFSVCLTGLPREKNTAFLEVPLFQLLAKLQKFGVC